MSTEGEEATSEPAPAPEPEPELDADGNPVLDEEGNVVYKPLPEPVAVAEPAVEPEPEEEEEEVDENAPPLGPPTKRTGPAITMMGRNKLVIFGGESEEVSMEDFVTLDLNAGTLKWVEHKPEGELFKPRKGAAICAAQGRCVRLWRHLSRRRR